MSEVTTSKDLDYNQLYQFEVGVRYTIPTGSPEDSITSINPTFRTIQGVKFSTSHQNDNSRFVAPSLFADITIPIFDISENKDEKMFTGSNSHFVVGAALGYGGVQDNMTTACYLLAGMQTNGNPIYGANVSIGSIETGKNKIGFGGTILGGLDPYTVQGSIGISISPDAKK